VKTFYIAAASAALALAGLGAPAAHADQATECAGIPGTSPAFIACMQAHINAAMGQHPAAAPPGAPPFVPNFTPGPGGGPLMNNNTGINGAIALDCVATGQCGGPLPAAAPPAAPAPPPAAPAPAPAAAAPPLSSDASAITDGMASAPPVVGPPIAQSTPNWQDMYDQGQSNIQNGLPPETNAPADSAPQPNQPASQAQPPVGAGLVWDPTADDGAGGTGAWVTEQAYANAHPPGAPQPTPQQLGLNPNGTVQGEETSPAQVPNGDTSGGSSLHDAWCSTSWAHCQ
jgi:hypothetical protein